MRLTFSILWFDDSEVYFDSLDVSSLEEEIREWGFEPRIEQVITPDEFMKRSPFEMYDLIVVDRNLEGYEDGQKFIANLRGNAIYTEVIFYTAGHASDLWNAIRENELEGIFVSSRNDILSKITKIGHQSIRKVLDLENMRGIVMAEVGELDHLLDEIITIGIGTLQETQKEAIFKRFHEKAIEQHQNNQRVLADFIENPETSVMLSLCDSNKRWQNFVRLQKQHEKLRKSISIRDYVKEILQPRNYLAHGKPVPHRDGGYLFHYQGKEFLFNDAASLEIRQTILYYKKEFSKLIELLNSSTSG